MFLHMDNSITINFLAMKKNFLIVDKLQLNSFLFLLFCKWSSWAVPFKSIPKAFMLQQKSTKKQKLSLSCVSVSVSVIRTNRSQWSREKLKVKLKSDS